MGVSVKGISVLVRKSVMCLEGVNALALVIREGMVYSSVVLIAVSPPHEMEGETQSLSSIGYQDTVIGSPWVLLTEGGTTVLEVS